MLAVGRPGVPRALRRARRRPRSWSSRRTTRDTMQPRRSPTPARDRRGRRPCSPGGAGDGAPARRAHRGPAERQVVATDGDPALSGVTMSAADGQRTTIPTDLLAVAAAGTPRSSSRAPSATVSATTRRRRAFVPRRDGARTGSRSWAPPRATVPGVVPDWVVHAGDDSRAFRRAPARPDRRRRRGRRSAAASERRTREARDLHRHGDRPRPHERRPDRRDREPPARVVAGRAGTDQRAPAVHARPVLGAGRAGPRSDPARPDPRDPDPRLARRARRCLRERRPVEAAPLLPAERGGHGRRRRARVPGGAHGRRRPRRSDARQDRGRRARRRRVPRPDVHEPDVEPCRRLDPLRADARPRRDGVRRRRCDAPGRGPLPRHDDDGRRGRRAGSVRGMAPDRVDRSAACTARA